MLIRWVLVGGFGGRKSNRCCPPALTFASVSCIRCVDVDIDDGDGDEEDDDNVHLQPFFGRTLSQVPSGTKHVNGRHRDQSLRCPGVMPQASGLALQGTERSRPQRIAMFLELTTSSVTQITFKPMSRCFWSEIYSTQSKSFQIG